MQDHQYPSGVSVVPCARCGSYGPDVDLICNNCGHINLNYGRRGRFGLVTFFVSVIGALALFRLSDNIWPLYLILALGIVHLYAVVFSRGAALTSASTLFGVITLTWGLCEAGKRLSSSHPGLGIVEKVWKPANELTGQIGDYIPLIIWFAAVMWAIGLGRSKALPGIRLASSYFLGTGAFIFGLWGVWGVLIDKGLAESWLSQLASILALVIPLILLIVLLSQQPPKNTGAGSWPQVAALWFMLITAYVLSTQLLTNLVDFGLGRFLPHLLEKPSANSAEIPWLIKLLQWRNPIDSVLVVFTLISILASSAIQTASGFTARKPQFYTAASARLKVSLQYADNPINHLVANLLILPLQIAYIVAIVTSFAARMLIVFAQDVVHVFKQSLVYLGRMFRYLVVPVCSFSLLSVLIILVLKQYETYIAGVARDPKVLWGQALSVMITVVFLCGTSFGFAQSAPRKGVELRRLFAGTEAAMLLGLIAYFLLSIVSLGLPLIWYGFRSARLDFSAISPGPVFWVNSVAVIVLSATLMVLFLSTQQGAKPAGGGSAESSDASQRDNVITISQVCVLVVFGIVALMFGMHSLTSHILAAMK